MDNKWNFEIMTDSAANLSEDVIRRYGLTILSQTYTMDGVEYRGYEKGKDISAGPVYEMMREKKEIRTSLVNAQEAEQEAEQLLRAGKDILYIGLSSALSGTFQVVRFTFEELQEKYPDRQLAAVDSLSLSLGEGELVLRAAKMREEGFSLRQTEQWLESNRLCLRQEFTVEDLFYLKRGGRIVRAGCMSKDGVYVWLLGRLNLPYEETHIGYFSDYLCEETIRECEKVMENWNGNRGGRAA